MTATVVVLLVVVFSLKRKAQRDAAQVVPEADVAVVKPKLRASQPLTEQGKLALARLMRQKAVDQLNQKARLQKEHAERKAVGKAAAHVGLRLGGFSV